MIGLDTNILVRYIVRDDARQTAAATRLVEARCTAESPGFVSQLVLAELYWVLSRGYGYPKPVLAQVLSRLLGSSELEVEDAADAWVALRAFEAGPVDFADLLIALRSRSAGCETVYTFDKGAAKSGLHTLLS